MSRAMVFFLAAVGLALASCTGPISPPPDHSMFPPQVYVTDDALRNDLYCTVLPAERPNAAPLDARVRLFNKTDREYRVDYQYHVVHSRSLPRQLYGSVNDAAIETFGWRTLRIPPIASVEIRITSMDAQAADFDLALRPTPQ